MKTKTTLAALLPFASLAILSVCFMSGCQSEQDKIVGTWEATGNVPAPFKKIIFTKGGSVINPESKKNEAIEFNVKSPDILTVTDTTLNKSFSVPYEITNDGLLIFKRTDGNAVFHRVSL